jgi:uncharacterized protein (TIGR02453 family)
VPVFKGWPQEALTFFEDLEEDNSKSFWQAHLDVYDRCVKAPMVALLGELEPEFGPGKLFRPYRDVRFSNDKSPYKTNIAATVGGDGYISLSAEGLSAGAGMYMMAPDQLARFRVAAAAERTGLELVARVAEVRQAGLECVATSPLKAPPRGYPKDHPRLDLLKGKGLIVWQQWGRAPWLGSRRAKERVVTVLRASAPLTRWLEANVGPSTAPPGRD